MKYKKILKNLILFLFIIIFIFAGVVLIWIVSLKIPPIKSIYDLKTAQSTKIFDRNGVLLFRLFEKEARTVIPITKISQNMINAIISVEDRLFFEHDGLRFQSMLMAVYENITGQRNYLRGGSTITQQVIKNTLLTSDRKITRKVKEMILAHRLENIWTKNQILEKYLNEIPFGGLIYGVEEASLYFFGKHASELTIAEAAYLASLPKAPTAYSPKRNMERLNQRQELVLRLMLNQGHITVEEYEQAKKENVKFFYNKREYGILAPHFVMDVVQKLIETYGPGVRTAGFEVHTSLDFELQEKLEKIAKEKISSAEEKKLGISNTGIIVLEPHTGHILAMVGSRNYFDTKIDGKFNVTTTLRQPGSAFKSVIYLEAFRQGFTPQTILWDVPTEFNPHCVIGKSEKEQRRLGCFSPRNFDGKYRGPIRIDQALAESRNIPAVKALYLVGINKILETARTLGINTFNRPASHYGLSLALGGAEIRLLELTAVHSVFATEGLRIQPIYITKIIDKEGKEIYSNNSRLIRVFEAKYIRHLNKILSNTSLRYPTFGIHSNLHFRDREVAVKTGTSDNFRDFWAIGHDPGNVAVGVWVGNNDNTSAASFASGRKAHAIWREAIEASLRNIKPKKFTKPTPLFSENTKPILRGIYQGSTIIRVNKKGGLATKETPREFIREIIIPEYHSILHWINKDNPRGPIPTPEQKDPAYRNWEQGIQTWLRNYAPPNMLHTNLGEALEGINLLLNEVDFTEINQENNIQEWIFPPKNLDNLQINEGEILERDMIDTEINSVDNKKFKIIAPNDGEFIDINRLLFIEIEEQELAEIKKYEFYINDRYFGSTHLNTFVIRLSEINEFLIEENFLEVIAKTKNGNSYSKVIKFYLK